MTLVPLPALADNHIWMLQHGRDAIMHDSGAAAPALAARPRADLQLAAILVTRRHPDHSRGVIAPFAGTRIWRSARQRKNEF
jgi:hydroxyacylglutathione hydrolase